MKKILILKKTSQLKYLIDKYGVSKVKKSSEYDVLYNSMKIQDENSTKFINKLVQKTDSKQHIQILTDSFLNNSYISDLINKDTFDQVYSLGGDGTFLRSVTLVTEGNPLFIGINTDLKRSRGYYCGININDDDIDDKLDKLLQEKIEEKLISRVKAECKDEKFYFVNDLYFGEKFSGRISKYDITISKDDFIFNTGSKFINDKELYSNEYECNLKSSGIIFSTCKVFNLRSWIFRMDSEL